MNATAVLLAIVLAATGRTAAGTDNENVRCGGHCLYVALRALDVEVGTYDELEGKLGPPGLEGYSLGKLEEVARSYGVQTLGVLTSFENLRRRKGRFACIAHLENPPHFVNFADVEERGSVFVIDPPGSYSAPADTLRTRWKGKALLLSMSPLVPEEALRPRRGWMIAAVLVAVLLAGWGMNRAFHRWGSNR